MERPLRDADATRARLLEAAVVEFARYGIAGARVDRIAAASQSNKAQIYHYFGSKEALFGAAFKLTSETIVRDIPMSADDLPGYAARLFDLYEVHPDPIRLATWHRLENGDRGALPEMVDPLQTKVDAISDAQRRGVVSNFFPARVVIGLVMQLSAMWVGATPEYVELTAGLPQSARRQTVIDAVTKLVQP